MKLKEEQSNEKGRFPQEFSCMTSRKEGGGHFDTWYLIPPLYVIETRATFDRDR